MPQPSCAVRRQFYAAHSLLSPLSVLARFSTAVINTMTENNLRRKEFVSVDTSQSQPVVKGRQGRNSQRQEFLEAGTEAQATEEYSLVNYSLWLAWPPLLYIQGHLPREGPSTGLLPSAYLIGKFVPYRLYLTKAVKQQQQQK